jgi:hypothetical protein
MACLAPTNARRKQAFANHTDNHPNAQPYFPPKRMQKHRSPRQSEGIGAEWKDGQGPLRVRSRLTSGAPRTLRGCGWDVPHSLANHHSAFINSGIVPLSRSQSRVAALSKSACHDSAAVRTGKVVPEARSAATAPSTQRLSAAPPSLVRRPLALSKSGCHSAAAPRTPQPEHLTVSSRWFAALRGEPPENRSTRSHSERVPITPAHPDVARVATDHSSGRRPGIP